VKWLASELDCALAVVRIGTHLCVLVRILYQQTVRYVQRALAVVRIGTHLCVLVRILYQQTVRYVQRHAGPSVMGLSPAPSVLAQREFVGEAPSVMVLRW
jgi:hypothetical protein